MKENRWTELAMRVSTGSAEEMEVLRERGTDVRIARTQLEGGDTVIVKCWNRPTLRGAIRRWTRTNIGRREYVALCRLQEEGTPCPMPLAYVHLPRHQARHTEALISSDLGACKDSTEVYKLLLHTDPEATRRFEEELIASTCSMIRRGLLDTDHRLPNFVVPADGIPLRIDFELCIPVKRPLRHPKQLGTMLGTFLGSVVFAVQPDLDRARDLSLRLFQELKPSEEVVKIAQEVLDGMMHRQHQEIGVNSSLTLEPPL